MIRHFYRRRLPLGGFVDTFCLLEAGDAPPVHELALATGTMELVINLADSGPRRSDAVLCGAHSRFFVIEPVRNLSVLMAHFYPGGASPFLGVPAGELHNQIVPLDTLWGRSAGELRLL